MKVEMCVIPAWNDNAIKSNISFMCSSHSSGIPLGDDGTASCELLFCFSEI